MKTRIVILTVLFQVSLCRDYYVGMFKKNDFLVAQDTVYKEKRHYSFTTAVYGRIFHCPITYFRVSDRLGTSRPPTVTVTRGGLQKKYITLRLTSAYDSPIAVNIYVGCKNDLTTTTATMKSTLVTDTTEVSKSSENDSIDTDVSDQIASSPADNDEEAATSPAGPD